MEQPFSRKACHVPQIKMTVAYGTFLSQNQIFHHICSNTLKRVTSLRGPTLRYCA